MYFVLVLVLVLAIYSFHDGLSLPSRPQGGKKTNCVPNFHLVRSVPKKKLEFKAIQTPAAVQEESEERTTDIYDSGSKRSHRKPFFLPLGCSGWCSDAVGAASSSLALVIAVRVIVAVSNHALHE